MEVQVKSLYSNDTLPLMGKFHCLNNMVRVYYPLNSEQGLNFCSSGQFVPTKTLDTHCPIYCVFQHFLVTWLLSDTTLSALKDKVYGCRKI